MRAARSIEVGRDASGGAVLDCCHHCRRDFGMVFRPRLVRRIMERAAYRPLLHCSMSALRSGVVVSNGLGHICSLVSSGWPVCGAGR